MSENECDYSHIETEAKAVILHQGKAYYSRCSDCLLALNPNTSYPNTVTGNGVTVLQYCSTASSYKQQTSLFLTQ